MSNIAGDEERTYTVYKHTVLANGKVYIGITSLEPKERWSNGHGYTKSQYFAKAIAKYGWDNISHEILFTGLTKDEANQKEIELIAEYDSTNHEKGYNIAKGGSGTYGVKPSEETKKKSSESHKNGKQPQAVAVICLETGIVYRSKAEAARSMNLSLKAIETYLQGRSTNCHGYHFDWVNDKDRREKVHRMTKEEAALLGCKAALPLISKEVGQYSLDDELVNVFCSVREAARETGCTSSHISECCRGIRKSCKGFVWRYMGIGAREEEVA